MEIFTRYLTFFFFFFIMHLCILQAIVKGSKDDDRKVYIVFMGDLPEVKANLIDHHHHLLMEAIGDKGLARQMLIHSYGKSFNGFAAKLLPHEADRLSQNENVVSVFPENKFKLQTTRSWDFLEMPINVPRNEVVESNIIIGLLDSGIYVPSKSFNDAGFSPPPKNWRGYCEKGDNFTGCNNKVIGARYFDVHKAAPLGERSPADYAGHGTHTSSIAAGVPVEHASLAGISEGTARGGVPLARIAMYKVCVENCHGADILAGFDAAIHDGVDVISVSLGGYAPDYLHDEIAIGSLYAVKRGIFVAAAAGNEDLFSSGLENSAPWILTVAASTIDRVIYAPLELGNGQIFHGNAINLYDTEAMYPLMNGRRDDGELKKEIRGKIVYCRGYISEEYVKRLGGVGVIKTVDGFTDDAQVGETPEPSTRVISDYQELIETYINSTTNPMARIYKATEVRSGRAPMVASFSLRGPDYISRKILKPDLAAPGVSILAAFSELTGNPVEYNILSGTSMATPHAASAAAYLKSFHPDWSPAILRSALITTAKAMKVKPEEAELASGAGNIDLIAALDPGLVYDIDPDSYDMYKCSLEKTKLSLRSGNESYKCPNIPDQMGYDGLNYPSFHYQLNSPNETDIAATFHRNVTYLGQGVSVYKVIVESPEGLFIKVEPENLIFNKTGQQKSFNVMLKGQFKDEKQWYLSGSIAWDDSVHLVKSPVLVYRPPSEFT